MVRGFIFSNPLSLEPSIKIEKELLLMADSSSFFNADATALFRIAVDLVRAQEYRFVTGPSNTSRIMGLRRSAKASGMFLWANIVLVLTYALIVSMEH
jgi:hypothetical protein